VVATVGATATFGEAARRYAAWFHELDAWTEYWDVYHPETHGRYYFGDGTGERGLLTRFLPHEGRPPPFTAWAARALYPSGPDVDRQAVFEGAVREPLVAGAVLEVDALVAAIFARHFGNVGDAATRDDYLEATTRFATDTLPPATERDARISSDDPRKPTAGRHSLDGDIQWFAWALLLEAADLLDRSGDGHSRRTLMLAGVASGCALNYATRGHRRTRHEYADGPDAAFVVQSRARLWATDFTAAANEVHALYRIREWGDPPQLSGRHER
jgi:hypothetical protein